MGGVRAMSSTASMRKEARDFHDLAGCPMVKYRVDLHQIVDSFHYQIKIISILFAFQDGPVSQP